MTQEDIEKKLIDNNDKMVEFMAQIRDAIRDMNDNSVLHVKSIDKNSQAILEMVRGNVSLIGFIRWIVMSLVIAVIALAGAEKVIPIISK